MRPLLDLEVATMCERKSFNFRTGRSCRFKELVPLVSKRRHCISFSIKSAAKKHLCGNPADTTDNSKTDDADDTD